MGDRINLKMRDTLSTMNLSTFLAAQWSILSTGGTGIKSQSGHVSVIQSYPHRGDDELLANRHRGEELIELPSGARQRKRRIFEDICNSDQNQHQHQDQNHQMRMAANSESELRRRRGAGKEKPAVEREKKKITASDLKVPIPKVIQICLFLCPRSMQMM